MENERFIEKANITAKSLYRISEETGVPYTTLSRLKNGRLDINKCSADVLKRLAGMFSCTIEDLMNPSPIMTGVHGTYRGYRYKWESEVEDDVLFVEDNGVMVEVDRNRHITNTKYHNIALTFTQMAIDIYVEKKEADNLCRNTF